MIFLIQYNRKSGQIVARRTFNDNDRERALIARLNLEMDLNAKEIEDEVVLLEATSEDVLRRTHRRYFEDFRELIMSPSI